MARPKKFDENQFRDELASFLQSQLSKKVTVKLMSMHFGVNPATLRSWSQAYTARSPKQLIAEYQISAAKKMLERNIKPTEISSALGFNDLKTFCSVFKRYSKMTPTQYMRAHKF